MYSNSKLFFKIKNTNAYRHMHKPQINNTGYKYNLEW